MAAALVLEAVLTHEDGVDAPAPGAQQRGTGAEADRRRRGLRKRSVRAARQGGELATGGGGEAAEGVLLQPVGDAAPQEVGAEAGGAWRAVQALPRGSELLLAELAEAGQGLGQLGAPGGAGCHRTYPASAKR